MSCGKLRVLHIITSLRTGGAERLVAELLPRLRERGHRPELLLFDGTRTPLYELLERQGIPIHVLGRGAFQMWNPLHLFRLRRFLQQKRFDVVHTHNTPCQLLTAAAAGRNAPILVTTEHNTFNRRRKWRWYSGIDRWMYGRYDRIVCVGEETRRNLADRVVGRALSVVPNGVALQPFLEARPDETLLDEADRGKRIIIMVAAFRAQKDQPTLIRAMQHLSDDYRLWLVGDWRRREACERLAEQLDVRAKIRFWGFRTDVPTLLATADVVVLSSHYEGMSLACIEGMASGRPFLASDVEGLRETVGGAGLLFPHEDDRALAERIRALCEDRELAAEVAARCRARAMQYDIDRTTACYEQLYNHLTQQKHST